MENRAHRVCASSGLWPLEFKTPLFLFFSAHICILGTPVLPRGDNSHQYWLLGCMENSPQESGEGGKASCGWRAQSSSLAAALGWRQPHASPQAKGECAPSWSHWKHWVTEEEDPIGSLLGPHQKRTFYPQPKAEVHTSEQFHRLLCLYKYPNLKLIIVEQLCLLGFHTLKCEIERNQPSHHLPNPVLGTRELDWISFFLKFRFLWYPFRQYLPFLWFQKVYAKCGMYICPRPMFCPCITAKRAGATGVVLLPRVFFAIRNWDKKLLPLIVSPTCKDISHKQRNSRVTGSMTFYLKKLYSKQVP